MYLKKVLQLCEILCYYLETCIQYVNSVKAKVLMYWKSDTLMNMLLDYNYVHVVITLVMQLVTWSWLDVFYISNYLINLITLLSKLVACEFHTGDQQILWLPCI